MQRTTAINDFYDAHRKASLKTVMSYITGKSVDLLSYEDVLAHLRLKDNLTAEKKIFHWIKSSAVWEDIATSHAISCRGVNQIDTAGLMLKVAD